MFCPPFTDIVWNKAVPLKVYLFVWWFLNKRIPRKNILFIVVLYIQGLLTTLGVASNKKQLIIYFWSAIFLGVYGCLFSLGGSPFQKEKSTLSSTYLIGLYMDHLEIAKHANFSKQTIIHWSYA